MILNIASTAGGATPAGPHLVQRLEERRHRPHAIDGDRAGARPHPRQCRQPRPPGETPLLAAFMGRRHAGEPDGVRRDDPVGAALSRPGDIAEAALYLCSERASHRHGRLHGGRRRALHLAGCGDAGPVPRTVSTQRLPPVSRRLAPLPDSHPLRPALPASGRGVVARPHLPGVPGGRPSRSRGRRSNLKLASI